ncbi:MAG: L-threonylcarbamoyladenylate synthase [Candidatus Firestonebacteria bacterium]
MSLNKILTLNRINFFAEKIKQGSVVGIPTDTVYGIAGSVYNKNAINRIYEIKNRPKNKPLVIFVSDSKEIENLVEKIPSFALKLMDNFWPGSLTLIFKSSKFAPKNVVSSVNTVGIRVPDCKVILDLLKILREPLAVTSANISGKRELSSACEVKKELGTKLDFILDGGVIKHKCVSTIVDVSGDSPVILRDGKLKKEQIEEVVMNVKRI